MIMRDDGDNFFGTGMMVAALKPDGTMACLRELLKMSVKTSFSSSAQSFSTLPGMLSGPAAFRVLMVEGVFFTLPADRHRGWSCRGGGVFCGRVLFCASKRAKKLFRLLSRVVSLSQLCGIGL